jgi:hypothetical protein
MAGKIEEMLRKAEIEAKLQAEYGYRVPAPAQDREPKTAEEVLKSARKALQDDEPLDKVAADK